MGSYNWLTSYCNHLGSSALLRRPLPCASNLRRTCIHILDEMGDYMILSTDFQMTISHTPQGHVTISHTLPDHVTIDCTPQGHMTIGHTPQDHMTITGLLHLKNGSVNKSDLLLHIGCSN